MRLSGAAPGSSATRKTASEHLMHDYESLLPCHTSFARCGATLAECMSRLYRDIVTRVGDMSPEISATPYSKLILHFFKCF